MSGVHMSRAALLDIPHDLKLTLLLLADHAHPDGTGAHPGVARLSRLACCAESTIRQHLTELRALGLIRRDAYADGGRGKATEFTMTFEGFPVIDCAPKPSSRSEGFQNPPAGQRVLARKNGKNPPAGQQKPSSRSAPNRKEPEIRDPDRERCSEKPAAAAAETTFADNLRVMPKLALQHAPADEAPRQAAGIWEDALGQLKTMVSRTNYAMFLEDSEGLKWDGATFTIAVPAIDQRDALSGSFHPLLVRALGDVLESPSPKVRVVQLAS